MITLAKNQIENVTVELTVEETIGSKLGGYPILKIGDVLIESTMVQEVDTLAIIKAIVTSETVADFEEKVADTWNAYKMVTILKAFALECQETDKTMIVENTIANGLWLDRIRKADDIVCDEEASPWDKTMAMARIYNYRKHLTFVPMSDELKEALGVDLDE